nr:hypothetical protein Ade03nite_63940 [Actinoplanes derwentensis]
MLRHISADGAPREPGLADAHVGDDIGDPRARPAETDYAVGLVRTALIRIGPTGRLGMTPPVEIRNHSLRRTAPRSLLEYRDPQSPIADSYMADERVLTRVHGQRLIVVWQHGANGDEHADVLGRWHTGIWKVDDSPPTRSRA